MIEVDIEIDPNLLPMASKAYTLLSVKSGLENS